MRLKYLLWLIIITLIHFTNWYFVMSFCAIYINSNKGWLIGSFISIGIDIILIKPVISTIKTLVRLLAKSYQNK